MPQLPTRSSTGVVLLEPAAHGDERGFLVETFRGRRLARARGRRRASSRTTTRARARAILRGLHFQTSRARRSWSAAAAERSGTSPSTCAATHRPTAVGGLRARRRAPPPALRPGRLRATASASSARGRRRSTSSRATTTPRPSPGSPGTTRRSGSSGRSRDPLLSERDRSAPRLAEIADTLPSEHASRLAGPPSYGADPVSSNRFDHELRNRREHPKSPLAPFSDRTRRWFEASFEAPTPAQATGWPAIASAQQHADLRADRLGKDARAPSSGGSTARSAEPDGP